jgi:uncharacterized protein
VNNHFWRSLAKMHHLCLMVLFIAMAAIAHAGDDAPAAGVNAQTGFDPGKYLAEKNSTLHQPSISPISANPFDRFDKPTTVSSSAAPPLAPAAGATNPPAPPPGFILDAPEIAEKALARLRLQKLENLPVNFRFEGYRQLNGVFSFQIHINDLPISEQPSLKKEGEDLGDGWVVRDFQLNFIDQENPATHFVSHVDKSTLDLENRTTGERVTITFRSDESYSSGSPVNFVLLIPSQENHVFKARRGRTFTLPYANTNYELIDAKDSGAVISSVKTQEHIFVPALGESEHVVSASKENDGLGTVVDDDEIAKQKAGNALCVHNVIGQVYSWTYIQNGQSYQYSPVGAYGVGLDYEWGNHGLEKDSSQAMVWYLRAANQGEPQAQEALGEVFLNGGFSHENLQTGYLECDNSVVKDDRLSFHWYQLAFQHYLKAAEKEDTSAMGNLVLSDIAEMYAKGHGVQKNGAEAIKWYRLAFERGSLAQAGALACLYDNGDCVPKDDIEALAWGYLAQASGDSFMSNYLENKLGPQNSLIAQQRSKELLAEIDKEKENQANTPKTFFGDPAGGMVTDQPKAFGSGVFISADGLFLTAAHVIEGSGSVKVLTQQGILNAKIVQVDRANDVALLKCEGAFKPVTVRPSGGVKLGQTVFTLGYPDIQIQGFSPKMTKGEISSLLGIQDDPRQWQVSVPVQPGNSGGPLFDEMGNLVGLIEAKLNAVAIEQATGDVPQNVNYALKSAYLMPMLDPYTSELPKDTAPPATSLKMEDVVVHATSSIGLVLVY